MLTLVRLRSRSERTSQAGVRGHGWCRRHEHAAATIRSITSSASCSRARRCGVFSKRSRRAPPSRSTTPSGRSPTPGPPISTPTTSLYFASAEGAPARRLRVREYAVAASRDGCTGPLGRRLHRAQAARGRRAQQDAPLGVARRDRAAASPATTCTSPRPRRRRPGRPIALELALPTMAPRVATWYRRLCLTGEGRRVRITLDENLTFCRPQPIGDAGALAAPNASEIVAAFPARVLEVKHCGEMPVWLRTGARSAAAGGRLLQVPDGDDGARPHRRRARERARDPPPRETIPFALGSFVAA